MRPPAEDPIRSALELWLTPERAASGVLLAVSGGPDSTALMHAAALSSREIPVHIATVDHGLRPNSAAEADNVGRAAMALGLPHRILSWPGPRPATGLQAAARAARYRLLAAHAEAVGAGLVLTGHTLDDQAETVLMRFLSGSGPAGLAGMRAERALAPGLRLARPFLALPKSDLVAWCEARGIAYLRDPSNIDDRFARARLRTLMPLLAREGLTPGRLARLAARAARDEDALREAAARALGQAESAQILPPASAREGGPRSGSGEGSTLSRYGAPLSRPSLTQGSPSPAEGGGEAPSGLRLHGPTVAALPDAVALRLLDLAMERAGAAIPRRLERLERLVFGALLPALRAGRPVRRTLRGLLIAADAGGGLTLSPAPARRNAALAAGGPELLGKGEPSAYIGAERSDGPAMPGRGSALPRD